MKFYPNSFYLAFETNAPLTFAIMLILRSAKSVNITIYYFNQKLNYLATIYNPGVDNYQLRYPLAIIGSEGGSTAFNK